jgi:two-component system, LytTR family, sensor kinase
MLKPDGTLVRWPIIFLIWAGIALMMATQNHVYQTALHLAFPDIRAHWSDSFRFPLVECLFWAVLSPGLLQFSRRFALFSSGWGKNITFLAIANVGVEFLHALYRLPFHTFVYPNMARIPFLNLFRYYLVGNSLNDLWVFWTIIGIGQMMSHYVRYMDREKELAKAQLQALTMQLQPHFLFNVLNSVSSLMREDVEAADDMIARFSDLMRTTLKSGAPQEISLHQELKIIGTYIDIERMRFQDRVMFSVNADAQILNAIVPTLILLPIVENAVKYAVAPFTRPCRVEVRATRELDELVLRVIDDGPGIEPGTEIKEGVGLTNTRTRLEHYYAGLGLLRYRNSERGGLEVECRMPLALKKMGTCNDTSADRR